MVVVQQTRKLPTALSLSELQTRLVHTAVSYARHLYQAHEQSSIEHTGTEKKATKRRERNLDLILEEGRKGRGKTWPHTTHRWIAFIVRDTRRL